MLESIVIADCATYSQEGQTLRPCKKVNFLFGTNGSGKTTISRAIADPDAYPGCRIIWKNGQPLERLVYNIDFVDRNISATLKGIFTLGEESADTIAKVDAAKTKLDATREEIQKLKNTLKGPDGGSGKIGELQARRTEFEDWCWTNIKNRHDEHFREVFEQSSIRGSKARFCDKVLEEQKNNSAQLCELEDLKARVRTVFQKGLTRKTLLQIPNFDDLFNLEKTSILKKKVIGKQDVNLSALITRLGNSDWVKQGRAYLERSGNLCPFCQQELLRDLAQELDEYFDETYAADIAEIERVYGLYRTRSFALLKELEEIIAIKSEYLSESELRGEFDRLGQRVDINLRHLEGKKKEPSTSVVLESLAEIVNSIIERIAIANGAIGRHNELVQNIAAEREKLIKEAWRFMIHEAAPGISAYLEEETKLEKAIAGINKGIQSQEAREQELINEISSLEVSITSVEPTVTEINNILASFGFTGFKLATAGERNNLYKIVRLDGSDASTTLSEGERSFIAFLYFYHLIRGSVSRTGVMSDRIVVFDDPVSSLDSDVLFIVSSLIKRIIVDVCEDRGRVKQVFVLTHNVYFHKEVAFDPKRAHECRAHETFWIVRKRDNASIIVRYDYNPVKTSYELLWSEVRNPDRSSVTIRNTLRRIVETYFKLLGNIDRDDIVAKFEGTEKQICGALFSWVNEGSHGVHDDLNISVDGTVIDRYLDVFRKIFEKTGQIAHYNMMMGLPPA